jgi:hypothetical protein
MVRTSRLAAGLFALPTRTIWKKVYWPFPLKGENISILIKDRTLDHRVSSPAR